MIAPVPRPVRKLLSAVCALDTLPEFNAVPISVNKFVKSLVGVEELDELVDEEFLVESESEAEELEELIPRSDANRAYAVCAVDRSPEPMALSNAARSLMAVVLNELLVVSLEVELVGGGPLGGGVLCKVVRAV